MARSANQKLKLVLINNLLLERTDEEHPITVKQIIAFLNEQGVKAERKSIYDDIETLKLFGTDIRTVKSKSTGYYVAERDFELSELKLLIDAVSASRFIPEKQSNLLIKKLSGLACAHKRASLNRQVFVSNRATDKSGDIFKTVDLIHESIESDTAICFKYFSWTAEKKKEYRRNGSFYEISPWALVWDDSCYYLIGYDNQKEEIRHFRVDKMEKAYLTDIPRIGKEQFKKFDIRSYSDAAFGMFGGTPQRITLSCKKRLANVMLDRFGKETPILNDGDSFRITVNVIPGPVFLGWILSFGNEVRILSPESIICQLDEIKRQGLKD